MFRDKNHKFEFNHKDVSKKHTIVIGSKSMTEKGICPNSLGKSECENYKYLWSSKENEKKKKKKKKYKFDKNCLLQHDKVMNKYYLYVTFQAEEKKIENRQFAVGLDPGSVIMFVFYSLNSYGKLGDNMGVKMVKQLREIKRLQSICDLKKNRDGPES